MLLDFIYSYKRLLSETKHKFIYYDSELYVHIIKIKRKLKENGFHHIDQIDVNVNILNDSEDDNLDTFMDRCNMLDGYDINESDPLIYRVINNSIIMYIGNISDIYASKDKINESKINVDFYIVIAMFNNNEDAIKAHKFMLTNILNLPYNENPIHTKLQLQLLSLVEEMKECKCPLPENLCLLEE